MVELLFESLATDTNCSAEVIKNLRIKQDQKDEEFAFQLNFLKHCNFLTNATDSTYVLSNSRICLAEYENARYLLITGISPTQIAASQPDLDKAYISFFEAKGGMLASFNAAVKLKLSNTVSSLQRENELNVIDAHYEGHLAEDLLKFFEDFCIFKIDAQSALYSFNDKNMAYFILSYFRDFIHLNFHPNLVDKFRDSLLSEFVHVKDKVFMSLTANHYKHSFLELYRCIEFLYRLPNAIKLKNAIGYDKSAYELSIHCYKELSWKNREIDSLNSVIATVDYEKIKSYQSLIAYVNVDISTETEVRVVEKIGDRIYKIRNQLVHQIDPSSEIEILNDHWGILLDFLLELINETFSHFKTELNIIT